jgi:hypothetical protein
MSAYPVSAFAKPPLCSPRLGRTSTRRHRRLRPQVAELEDRTVLSSVQPAILSYPSGPVHGPAVVTAPVFDFSNSPVHGPARGSGPASNFPNGPCFPSGPCQVV